MVNDRGQIYTIEGVAAGVLMVVTAYLVVSTTTVLTPQDVHIVDMQLQQLGNDALAMMDTPDQYNSIDGRYSNLTKLIIDNNQVRFGDQLLMLMNSSTNIIGTGLNDFNYQANLSYWNVTNQVNTGSFGGQTYYRENAVKVSRWVYLPPFPGPAPFPDMRSDTNQTVLLEVLLWRE